MAKYLSESGLSFEIIPKEIDIESYITTVYFDVHLELRGKSLFDGLTTAFPFHDYTFCEFGTRQFYLDDLEKNFDKPMLQSCPTEPDIEFTIMVYVTKTLMILLNGKFKH
jgi:hypothetical protein